MVKDCNHTILVVEDDDDIRNAVVVLLELEGFKPLSASNGQEALEILATAAKPCLILLDMMMPVMNGREFLDELMKDASISPLPVIIVSAIADKVNIVGAEGFIKKPADLDAILNIVTKYCSH